MIISIHSLPKEGDDVPLADQAASAYFNPLPPQGGRLKRDDDLFKLAAISIHSLPKEGD